MKLGLGLPSMEGSPPPSGEHYNKTPPKVERVETRTLPATSVLDLKKSNQIQNFQRFDLDLKSFLTQ